MKPTKKQIEAEIRRKMAASYNSHIESLKKRIDIWADRATELAGECDLLKIENASLKEQIRQYEDWNERLMEFMDMDDHDRKQAIVEWRTAGKYNEYIVNLYKKLGLMGVFEL